MGLLGEENLEFFKKKFQYSKNEFLKDHSFTDFEVLPPYDRKKKHAELINLERFAMQEAVWIGHDTHRFIYCVFPLSFATVRPRRKILSIKKKGTDLLELRKIMDNPWNEVLPTPKTLNKFCQKKRKTWGESRVFLLFW